MSVSPRANGGLASRSGGRSGAGALRCQSMNPAAIAADAASPAADAGEVHPQELALDIVSSSVTTAPVESAAPGQSNGPAPRPAALSPAPPIQSMAANEARPKGAIIKTIQRQPSQEMTEPPARGPKMNPDPPTSMYSPMARPLCAGGKAVMRMAMLVACTAALPTPWSAFRPDSDARSGAAPAAMAPAARTAAPARYTRRGPIMSATRPRGIISEPIARM